MGAHCVPTPESQEGRGSCGLREVWGDLAEATFLPADGDRKLAQCVPWVSLRKTAVFFGRSQVMGDGHTKKKSGDLVNKTGDSPTGWPTPWQVEMGHLL